MSAEGLEKGSYCMVFKAFHWCLHTVWMSCPFERFTCRKVCRGQGKELVPLQVYLCEEAALLLSCVVQLFSLLGDWVLHGLSAETNWLRHKTGSILHLNLMYAILGDYEGAGRGFAEPMSAFVVCLGMYKKRSLPHTGVFETQMPFGMSYLRRGGFRGVFCSLYHLLTTVYLASQFSFSSFAIQHKYFNCFSPC